MVRNYRKPLVVVAPKKLLKLRDACSDLDEFAEGTRFTKVYTDKWEERVPDDKVRRVVFCSGQVYYDLVNERKDKGLKDIAICRLEQISPFPWGDVTNEVKKFKNAEFVWSQEEHKNMGAYQYVDRRFDVVFDKLDQDKSLTYAGRLYAAASSTGWQAQHKKELRDLLDAAI